MSSRTLPRSRERMRSPRVLVVDDDADTRELFVEVLRIAGFEAMSAADAPAALELARSFRPAVITMDLSLPGMNGCDATRALKADPLTRHIIVFAITGHVEPSYEEEARHAGVDLFLTKPCLPQVLLDHLLRVLDRRALDGASGSG